MKLPALANQLSERLPQACETIRLIRVFDSAAAGLPWEPFYEPVSLIDQDEKGRGKHINVDPPMLNAWAKHISYSMRARLRSFEPSILHEVLHGTSLGASTLLRAHLEAAAMAALCVMELNQARAPDGFEKLASLISQTLFGTALFNKAKKDDRILEMLTYAEQRTVTICTAIDALDSFAYGDNANGSTTILYAILCESSHPNHRGTRPFAQSEEVKPEGWRIRYAPDETMTAETTMGILDGLMRSMRAGYAAVEMLRVAEFLDEPLPYHGIPTDEGQRIWSTFLAPDA